MTADTPREVIRRAIEERRSRAAGGCFSEHEPDSSDDCYDGTCPCAKTVKRDTDAILSALAAAGYAVVPKEATVNMDAAGHDAIATEITVTGEGIEIALGGPGRIYRAMLAAAQDAGNG